LIPEAAEETANGIDRWKVRYNARVKGLAAANPTFIDDQIRKLAHKLSYTGLDRLVCPATRMAVAATRVPLTERLKTLSPSVRRPEHQALWRAAKSEPLTTHWVFV
jgi:hypothetical protein